MPACAPTAITCSSTALSYGLVEYLRTLGVMAEMGWSSRRVVPHGGLQMSLNIAAGLHLGGNESYPDVCQPFGGLADGIRTENGYIGLPDVRGPASRQSQRSTRSCASSAASETVVLIELKIYVI